MGKRRSIRVGISIGDLNGIGSEIILKTFQDKRMLEFCTPIIFASTKVISHCSSVLGIDIHIQGVDDVKKIIDKKINVVNVWNEHVDINFGKEEKTAGSYAIKSLEAAVAALKTQAIDVLVTAPIHKSNVQSESFNFPGHTDYLAKELDGDSLMLMISNDLRVGLLTDHVAVKNIAQTITRELIEKKINTINKTLIQDFGIEKPKIAVLGINPHNGDNGVIGLEDDELLKPTLDNLRNNGKLVFGPYAADSFFGSGNYKNFDVVIASYHDQGLIPFKTLAFGNGVNFTAGLSHVRTSPDHGTAFDLAGQGKANYESFREAVYSAISIHKTRKRYLKMSANPLEIKPKRRYSKKK